MHEESQTVCGEVIDKEYFIDEVWRGAIQHAVDCAEQSGPSLVVEDDHHSRVGQH